MFFETGLALIICYVKPVEIALGGRALASPHFAVPSSVFFTIIFFYDELRKLYVRNGIRRTEKKAIYDSWLARNTKY